MKKPRSTKGRALDVLSRISEQELLLARAHLSTAAHAESLAEHTRDQASALLTQLHTQVSHQWKNPAAHAVARSLAYAPYQQHVRTTLDQAERDLSRANEQTQLAAAAELKVRAENRVLRNLQASRRKAEIEAWHRKHYKQVDELILLRYQRKGV